MTPAAIRRRRMIARLTAFVFVLCVIVVGLYLTMTMLFKINSITVQTADGHTVSEVGGYSSEEILQTLGVYVEENIFSFDPSAKASLLERTYPMLEDIRVVRDYPNAVVVRVTEAVPAYAMQVKGGWLTLSDGLKILAKGLDQPDLPTLYGGEPVSTTPGNVLEFAAETTAAASGSESDADSASIEEDQRLDALSTLMSALESYSMLGDVTRIEFADISQMAFLYQDRISVELGTLNELDYKISRAQYVLLNECAATDTGVLDMSHLSASSTRQFLFAQGEAKMPSGYMPQQKTEQVTAEPEQSADSAADTTPETATTETTTTTE